MGYETDIKYVFNVQVEGVEWWDPNFCEFRPLRTEDEAGAEEFAEQYLSEIYAQAVLAHMKEGCTEITPIRNPENPNGFVDWHFGRWANDVLDAPLSRGRLRSSTPTVGRTTKDGT
jgi:hypothetical protein